MKVDVLLKDSKDRNLIVYKNGKLIFQRYPNMTGEDKNLVLSSVGNLLISSPEVADNMDLDKVKNLDNFLNYIDEERDICG